jgi:manganese transport protein
MKRSNEKAGFGVANQPDGHEMQSEIVALDPYALPAEAIQTPPKSAGEILRKIGPGIVLAGTIVGSGELILTTSLGAEFGFVFLWLILFSCFIKVFIQIELGRYAISSGKPTLGALNQISGLGRLFVWWWFVMLVCTVVQLGGMTGTIGQAMDMAFPAISNQSVSLLTGWFPAWGEFFSQRREFPMAVMTCLVTMALIYRGGYGRIEWLTTAIVVSCTCLTVLACASLNWTEYPITAQNIQQGLWFNVPGVGIAAAFAVFGITGVGATELFYYPYWCLEKGYARYVGVNDGSPEWHERAAGWIKVLHYDAWISMVVYTLSTIAFYFMGAAVLNAKGLNPKGPKLVETLSEMYAGPFGDWARILFLFAAAAVLFKTLYLSCAANSRLTVDLVSLTGIAKIDDPYKRANWVARFCLIYPCLALFFYCIARDPKLMVKIGGFAQAATLPMIAAASVYFRYFKLNRRLKPNKISDLFLWIALGSIFVAAAYAVPKQLFELWKMLLPG